MSAAKPVDKREGEVNPGPVAGRFSPDGRSSTGAFGHGEDNEAYNHLLGRFQRERRPAGLAEELLVGQLAACGHQLQQIPALKKKILLSTSMAPGVLSRLPPEICRKIYLAGLQPYLPKDRPLTKEMLEAAISRAPSLAEMVGGDEQNACLTLADLNLLLKFQKYERELTAAFSRTLQELDRIQESRRRQSEMGKSARSFSSSKVRDTSDGSARGTPAGPLGARVAPLARHTKSNTKV